VDSTYPYQSNANLYIYRNNEDYNHGIVLHSGYTGVGSGAMSIAYARGAQTSDTQPVSRIEFRSASSDFGKGYIGFQTRNGGANSLHNRLWIEPNGHIGIGTSTPNYLLHVYRNATGEEWAARFQNGSCNVHLAYSVGVDSGGSGLHINTGTASSSYYGLNIHNGVKPIFRVTAAGRVGINTGSPNYTLHVAGSLYASSTVRLPNLIYSSSMAWSDVRTLLEIGAQVYAYVLYLRIYSNDDPSANVALNIGGLDHLPLTSPSTSGYCFIVPSGSSLSVIGLGCSTFNYKTVRIA